MIQFLVSWILNFLWGARGFCSTAVRKFPLLTPRATMHFAAGLGCGNGMSVG